MRRPSSRAGSAGSADRPFDPADLRTFAFGDLEDLDPEANGLGRDADDDAPGDDDLAGLLLQQRAAYAADADPDAPYVFAPHPGVAPGQVEDPAAPRTAQASFDFEARLRTAPERPGVYLMHDRGGQVVYVGKASNLRARLRQYAQGQDERFFVHQLRQVLAAIELIVTASEKEALLLENELIKRHQPRYNVKLKDDKRFLHLRLDSRQPFPRLQVVRRPAQDGAQYFGPYASASAARQAIGQINRHFQLRTCPDSVFRNRVRPCLEYQIHRCLGPCVLPVDPDDYAAHVKDVALFLGGRRSELVARLKQRMAEAAEAEHYERAGRHRDQLRAIETSLEQQATVLAQHRQRMDAIGLYREGARVCVAVLTFREGTLLSHHGHLLKDQEWSDAEVVAGFCQWLYDQGQAVPDELLLPVEIADPEVLAEWLGDLRRQRAHLSAEVVPRAKVEVVTPARGVRAKLLQAAADNARQTFEDRARKAASQSATLLGLQARLRLRKPPRRIECYDISNIQGTDPTGSMSVAWDGALAPREYRTFAVRSLDTPNDFAMLYEVLSRRFERVQSHGWPLPDLVMIDGGKGQLKMAVAVLAELGIGDVELCSLAKARTLDSDDHGPSLSSAERVFLPGIKNPLVLPQNSNELYLLTQLRDEAHRLAIGLHRKRRDKRTLVSRLDKVPGVGPQRKKALLEAFGSVQGIRDAAAAEVAAVPGVGAALAQRVQLALGRKPGRAATAAPADPTEPGPAADGAPTPD